MTSLPESPTPEHAATVVPFSSIPTAAEHYELMETRAAQLDALVAEREQAEARAVDVLFQPNSARQATVRAIRDAVSGATITTAEQLQEIHQACATAILGEPLYDRLFDDLLLMIARASGKPTAQRELIWHVCELALTFESRAIAYAQAHEHVKARVRTILANVDPEISLAS